MICIVGILVLGQIATENLSASVSGIFNGFIYATKELIRTIFIISIVVSMSRVLIRTGINELMAAPLTRFMRTPALAFWGIGVVMLVVSWFFWPSPGVALIGAVLLPAAVRVGLPALGAAMAMNLFGHGIALSGDYIIQGAPKLTADAAGLKVSEVMQASVPLVIVMSVFTTGVAYWMMLRDRRRGTWQDGLAAGGAALASDAGSIALPLRVKQWAAVLIPILFLLDVVAMFALVLQGGDATALIGGTAVLILLVLTLIAHRNRVPRRLPPISSTASISALKFSAPSSRSPLSSIWAMRPSLRCRANHCRPDRKASSTIWGWRWPTGCLSTESSALSRRP